MIRRYKITYEWNHNPPYSRDETLLIDAYTAEDAITQMKTRRDLAWRRPRIKSIEPAPDEGNSFPPDPQDEDYYLGPERK